MREALSKNYDKSVGLGYCIVIKIEAVLLFEGLILSAETLILTT